MSVYLTMVFSNKMMKGLLFSLCQWGSQCLSSDSETAGMRIFEYVVHSDGNNGVINKQRY